jgi:hypothetical protein
MAVLVRPPTKLVESRPVEVPAVEADSAPSSGANRWFLVLGVPFVLGAAFFALAIGLGTEWPIAPAFCLGPLLLICGYIYLSLSSESNEN